MTLRVCSTRTPALSLIVVSPGAARSRSPEALVMLMTGIFGSVFARACRPSRRRPRCWRRSARPRRARRRRPASARTGRCRGPPARPHPRRAGRRSPMPCSPGESSTRAATSGPETPSVGRADGELQRLGLDRRAADGELRVRRRTAGAPRTRASARRNPCPAACSPRSRRWRRSLAVPSARLPSWASAISCSFFRCAIIASALTRFCSDVAKSVRAASQVRLRGGGRLCLLSSASAGRSRRAPRRPRPPSAPPRICAPSRPR